MEPSSTTTARKKRPRATEDGWADARPVAKQAAAGSDIDTILAYARASAAAGGFDRADARLARKIVSLDDKGFAQLSKACEKLVADAEKIEAASAQRIAKNPKRQRGRGRHRRHAVRGQRLDGGLA